MVDLLGPLERFLGRRLSPVARRWIFGVGIGATTFGLIRAFDPTVAVGAGLFITGVTAVALALLGRPPRAPKEARGFLIAIDAEDKDVALRLRNDFVGELRLLAERIQLSAPLHVVELDAQRAAEVRDPTSALKAAVDADCQLILFGAARQRTLGGKQQNVLDVRILVRHLPIPREKSSAISREMDRALPRQFLIPADGDFLGFALVSEFVAVAAQYTVALVSATTGDLDYAEELFNSVNTAIGPRLTEVPMFRDLATRVRGYLHQVYGLRATKHFQVWGRTRDKTALMRQEVEINKLLTIDPENEFALLGRAICAFVLRRDVKTAWNCIRKCRNSTTGTWRYSEAFLNLYERRLDRARSSYKAAAVMPTDEVSDYLQSEVFLHEVLEEEPDRIEMLFGMGMINLLVKQDLDEAERDFTRFREADRASRYAKYHAWAEAKLREAKERSSRANTARRKH